MSSIKSDIVGVAPSSLAALSTTFSAFDCKVEAVSTVVLVLFSAVDLSSREFLFWYFVIGKFASRIIRFTTTCLVTECFKSAVKISLSSWFPNQNHWCRGFSGFLSSGVPLEMRGLNLSRSWSMAPLGLIFGVAKDNEELAIYGDVSAVEETAL